MPRPELHCILLGIAASLLLAGCQDYWAGTSEPPPGDAEKGAALISSQGCGSCHIVPGIIGADGLAGPSLENIALRGYLAGVLPNTHDNMVQWLLDPPAVDPLTAMPDLGLTQAQATDIAAYLDTLQ